MADAKAGRWRIGISIRLVTAFAGLAALAAAAGGASSWFSKQSAGIVTSLGTKALPTVVASLDFALQSTALLSEAPGLATESDPASLNGRLSRLEAIQARQGSRLSELRSLVDTPSVLDGVAKHKDELAPKIAELKAVAAERITLQNQIDKTLADALSHYQDLVDFVRPLQEATKTAVDGEVAALKTAVAGAGAAGGSPEQVRMLDADLATLQGATGVQASANLAFGMISAAAYANTEALTDIRSQLNWAEVYLDKTMQQMGASDDATRIKPLVQALLAGGSGPDGVLVLRTRAADVQAKLAALLGDLDRLGAAAGDDARALVAMEETAARTAIGRSEAVTRETLTVNTAASGIVILAALCCAFYVRRSIARRLTLLAGVMGRLAAGDRGAAVVATGRDEITDMAASVAVFRQNLVRGDELAAEATLMAQEREASRATTERERAAVAARQAETVGRLASVLAALAQADLTAELDSPFPAEYESLRRDFNAAAAQLRAAMSDVVETAASIRAGTSDIAGAADDLSRRTEQQAATLEESAAALREVTNAIRQTAEGAAHAKDLVLAAKGKAETSGAIMADAVTAMGAIEASSGEIGQIIGVVDEIAFQTSLLALNAGVEAARAGDAGRGFAVVASEVRALAQRSAEAAKQIKTLVTSSRAEMAHGVALVGQGGTALRGIIDQVSEISAIMSEIARGANEQILGLDQINVAVGEMDRVTQQNAAMVEQTTAASHQLVHDTASLADQVGRFRVDVSSARATPATPLPASVDGALRRAAPQVEPAESWDGF